MLQYIYINIQRKKSERKRGGGGVSSHFRLREMGTEWRGRQRKRERVSTPRCILGSYRRVYLPDELLTIPSLWGESYMVVSVTHPHCMLDLLCSGSFDSSSRCHRGNRNEISLKLNLKPDWVTRWSGGRRGGGAGGAGGVGGGENFHQAVLQRKKWIIMKHLSFLRNSYFMCGVCPKHTV